MRLKTSPLSCAFAWAPASLGTPTYIAAASLAGAMDDDFSNEAFLEIRLVDVTQTDETDMPVVGRTIIPERAFRVDWCSFGGPCGLIAVGCSNGAVYIYDAGIIMKNYQKNPNHNSEDPLLCSIVEHRGAVRGCQFNPSQPNFLAVGADDGEWDVWTLEDPREPQRVPVMSNAAHSAAIVHLQWHPKYPHIIATASANSIVNVWNLKSQSLAVSLNVSKGGKTGVSANAIAWHPVVATQIAVGLDEKDPVIQIWDLKKSMVPLREIRGHESAVTGLAWNQEDASMIASCGADGRTIWWDPATGEQSGALQQESGYIIDAQWSPVLPAVLATSSFEPLLCVSTAEDVSTTTTAGSPAPKWLKKPCGASISVGGFIASLVPHSTTMVGLTHIVERNAMSPTTSQDLVFRKALQRFPRGSEERVGWLREENFHLFAAAAACKDDRTPILVYLNDETTANDDVEDPFETMQASKKRIEDVAAAHIAAGRIREAVEVCLDERQFDDAFAIAYLQGGKLLQRVQQEYAHYTLKNHPQKRHVVYAAAIASGDFASLTAGEGVPWKEALSVIISFVGEGFSEACDKLGEALKKEGNREGAFTCFVCSGNLDAVLELWREDNVPVRKMMREALLLEEVTGRRVTSSYFADCLHEYGMRLVGDGLITEAVSILQRSASIGNRGAAIMVDRLKYEAHLAQVAFPFSVDPLSDSPSPSCLAFLTEKQQQYQQYQQLPQASMGMQQPQLQPMPLQQQQQPQQQQQQQPIPHQNMYTQQQQAPPMMQTGGPVPSAPTMPTNTNAATTTTVAPPPRLMPHPISSYSSMRQGAPVSSVPPPPPATGNYNNGLQSVPSHKSPQMAAPGVYSAPQQSYVDPSKQPPPLPGASRSSSMQSTPAQPPGPPQPPRMQQTGVHPGNSGVSMPPPPPSGTSVALPQQAGGFNATPQLPSRGPSMLGVNSTPYENSAAFPNMQTPVGTSSLYNNPSSRKGSVGATGSHPPPPQTVQGGVPPPPPPVSAGTACPSVLPAVGAAVGATPGAPTGGPPRATMPAYNNPSGISTPKDGLPGDSVSSYRGMGNATLQAQSLSSSQNRFSHQNVMPQPAGPTPSLPVYRAPSNEQRPGPPSTAYGGGTFPSSMPLHPSSAAPPPPTGGVDDGGLSLFDINSLNPAYQALARKLCADIQKISNAQRRSAVSKAALELFKLLQQGALSSEVVGLLTNYVNTTGTPAGKSAWRQLSDMHFDAIQPILNLKFL
ncbi:WD40 repeat [Trypanosoma melophagium]|uniref:WD40 repeat n=1 Tax=Trypanosoma melophagium TaxID=715481 RepID=UPI00351A7ABA|nr:WD40 repeat [Trypanosoma melophagium]